MSTLTVRRLLVDLETPVPRHWAGDAFRRAFFNALSMSFPAGEQLFIDSLRKGMAHLWDDGTWWHPSTWVRAWRLLFGHHGFVARGRDAWRRYLRADFHPNQADGSASETWLREHAALVPPVRAAA